MTDSMPTARMIQPAQRTQGPLAVGDRRQREKRQAPMPRLRPKAEPPAAEPDPETDRDSAHGKAIDIRI